MRSITEQMLEDGRTVWDPDREQQIELERLEQLGLVKLTWSEFFYCVDHQDDRDLPHAWKRSCSEKIRLDSPRDREDPYQREDDLEYVCECGRSHWPIRRRRTTYPLVDVALDIDGVEWFVAQRVRAIDPTSVQLAGGVVHRLVHGGTEIYVCLLDRSADTRFATQQFAMTSPVLFLVIDHRFFADRFPDEAWLVALHLHELASDDAVLGRKLDELAQKEYPLNVSSPVRPWLPQRRPPQRRSYSVDGPHTLEVGGETAKLDGVEVVPVAAVGTMAVLRCLVRQWAEDVSVGKNHDSHCFLSHEEIWEKMRDDGIAKVGKADTVRTQIRRLRENIAKNFLEATGLDLGPDAVIEHDGAGSYRLKPTMRVSFS